MQSVRDILKKFNPVEDKYVSREFQAYGVHLAERLEDTKHKSLYMKLAKNLPRPILEEAFRFVVDSRARNKGALFMWKLKQMGAPLGAPAKGGRTRKSQVKSAAST